MIRATLTLVVEYDDNTITRPEAMIIMDQVATRMGSEGHLAGPGLEAVVSDYTYKVDAEKVDDPDSDLEDEDGWGEGY